MVLGVLGLHLALVALHHQGELFSLSNMRKVLCRCSLCFPMKGISLDCTLSTWKAKALTFLETGQEALRLPGSLLRAHQFPTTA
jgi:hypothetical protein